MNVKGLHVWEIEVEEIEEVLWVTTAEDDPKQALLKSERHLMDLGWKLNTVTIVRVEHMGTIDC